MEISLIRDISAVGICLNFAVEGVVPCKGVFSYGAERVEG